MRKMLSGLSGLTVLLILVGFSALDSASAGELVGASGLTVNRDGSMLAFSYQGDIWTVSSKGGAAARQTIHQADDQCPVFSPDGKNLAFSSNRFGNLDVFTMSLSDGSLKRLTWDSQDDLVLQYDPAGEFIAFNSYRDFRQNITWKVPVKGGEPRHLCPLDSASGKFSPDGRLFLYQNGHAGAYRQGYRGESSTDLFVYDFETGQAKQLTETLWNTQDPNWAGDGQTIYYISEESGSQNIHKMLLDGSHSQQLTQFSHGIIHDIAVPDTGDTLFFCRDARVYSVNNSGDILEVQISVPGDRRRLSMDTISFSNAGEIILSRDDKEIILEHRGDLFAMDIEGGDTNPLTETPWREKCPRWHPEDGSLYYIGDRTGNSEMYRLVTDDGDRKQFHKARFFKEERVFQTDVPMEYFELTPDAKSIVYLGIDGRFMIRDIDGSNPRELSRDVYMYSLSISPDSQWAAFIREFGGLHYDVYIMELKTGDMHQVSRLYGHDSDVRFSPDGRQLLMVSGNDGDDDIYAVWLDRKDHEKYKDDDTDNPPAETTEAHSETTPESGNDSTGTDEIKVDLRAIHERVRRLVGWPSSEKLPMLTPDGKTLIFKSNAMGKTAIYKAEIDGFRIKNPQELASVDPEQLQMTQSGNTIVYRCKNSTGSVDIKTGKVTPIRVQGKMQLDRVGEYLQMYREAWNTIKYQFYDENLHGTDWNAAFKKYLPLVRQVRTAREFRDVILRLIGELNASHLGIYGGDDPGMSGEVTGRLGCRLGSFVPGKGYEIIDVVPDTPGFREESRLYPGEFIHGINRHVLSLDEPVASYLNDTVNKVIDVDVFNSDAKPHIRTVTLKPISPGRYHQKAYYYWIEQNRQKVAELSDNSIGYLHIQAMNGRSLEKFRNELFGLLWEKSALIIDVRGNPGGNIHNQLLRHLYGDSFGWSKPRLGNPTYHPDYVWRKPSVVLIDEHSFSDAEVFPNGYQSLGIGKVIGMPTFGGVIGTGGFTLLNGAWFRLPWVGWYTAQGRNMENTGAVPDIKVKRDPEEKLQGRDSQIDRAVKELLSSVHHPQT